MTEQAVLPSSMARPRLVRALAKRTVNWRLLLLLLLVVTSANIGLVNNRVALKYAGFMNLVGARDIAVMLCLMGSLFVWRTGKRLRLLTNPYCLIAAGYFFLTPISAMTAAFGGAQPYSVASGAFTMLSWALCPAVALLVGDRRGLEWGARLVVVTGLLISAGIVIEALTRWRWQLVTPAALVTEGLIRPTASGSMSIMIGMALLFARTVFTPRLTLLRRAAAGLGWLVQAFAVYMTMSRTLLLGALAGPALAMGIGLIPRRRHVQLGPVVALALAAVAAYSASVVVTRVVIGELHSMRMVARFGMLLERDPTQWDRPGGAGGRFADIRAGLTAMASSPYVGLGVGSRYAAEEAWGVGREGRGGHSVIAGMAVRFGVPGLALYVLLMALVLRSLARALTDGSDMSYLGIGLSTGVASLAVCSLFGGVFTAPYLIQQAMVGLGLLVTYEQLRALRVDGRAPRRRPAVDRGQRFRPAMEQSHPPEERVWTELLGPPRENSIS